MVRIQRDGQWEQRDAVVVGDEGTRLTIQERGVEGTTVLERVQGWCTDEAGSVVEPEPEHG